MNRARGFTLIEILVAVALLSLLGLASAVALNASLRSQATIDRRVSALEHLRSAQALIRSDLEQVVSRLGRDSLGDSRPQAFETQAAPNQARDGEFLTFFRHGRRVLGTRFPGTPLERVRYRLEGQTLIRDSSPVLDPAIEGQWRSRPLLEAVEGVRLSFFHDGRWHAQWPPLGAVGVPAYPRSVELTLTLPAYGALRQRVLLPESP